MTNCRSVLVPLPAVHWGGLQAFAATLNGVLRDAGWRWIVVIPVEAAEVAARLKENGVDVVSAPLPRLRRSPGLTLQALPRLWRDMDRLSRLKDLTNISVVQAVGAHHPHGAMLAKRLRKPLVWQIHSGIVTGPARWLAARAVTSRSNAIMTNGYGIAKAFWGRENLGPNHFVFYAPVDASKFAPQPELRREVRKQLGYSDDSVVIGTVGNRVWQKNHQFLVKSAAQISDRNPKVRFLILGDTADTYRKQYEKEVEIPAGGLNQKVSGLIKILSPGRDVHRWIHAVDVFTLTSHTEGVPIALFEAMSAAQPAVCANVGSISEVIDEGCTGFLYQPGNLDEYINKLLPLCSNHTQRTRMGAAGRARILSCFSLNSVADAHIRAYESALRDFANRKQGHER